MNPSERVRALLVDGDVVELGSRRTRTEEVLARLSEQHAVVRAVGELLANYFEDLEREEPE